MSEYKSVERVNALREAAEAVTGETYSDLAAGVQALIAGYGQGGGDSYEVFDGIFNHTITEFNYTKEADWTIDASNNHGSFGYMFNSCYKLQKWAAPNLTWREVAGYMFRGCKPETLKYIDFGKPNYFAAAAFYGFKLNGASVIIRSETVPTLRGAFTGTGITNSYFYVRSSLVDEFKGATNWATYADLFRPLEDYTVDGTASGELDMNKV